MFRKLFKKSISLTEKEVEFHVSFPCRVTKVFSNEGHYVNKEQPVFEFIFDDFNSGTYYNLAAEENCKIKNINVKENKIINLGDIIYSYEPLEKNEEFEQKALEFRKPILEDTSFAMTTDDFTDDVYIKPYKIAGKQEEYIRTFIFENNSSLGLGFSLETFNNLPFINVRSLYDEIRLAKGDEMILLFEDQVKINLLFSRNPSGGNGIKINLAAITFEMLQILLTKNFLKWKYIDNKTNEYLLGTFSCEEKKTQGQYSSIIEAQYLLRFYTAKFIEANKTFNNKDHQ